MTPDRIARNQQERDVLEILHTILTKEGKPWLVLRAFGSGDHEDSTPFTGSPEFWQMIHERRQEQGIPWEETRKELGLDQTGD